MSCKKSLVSAGVFLLLCAPLVGCDSAGQSAGAGESVEVDQPVAEPVAESPRAEPEEVATTPEEPVEETEVEEEAIPSWEEEEEPIVPDVPVDAPEPAELCSEGNCYSSLDDVVLDHYAKRGVEFVPEQTEKLCRRLAVDLWGRVPTWLEVEQGERIGKSPHEMVDQFMDSELYIQNSQRIWADEFQYHDGVVWWEYIKNLDELVESVYRAEISYEGFATAALIHPAFVSRYEGEMVVANAFRIFMERDALVSERKDLLKAWHIWDTHA